MTKTTKEWTKICKASRGTEEHMMFCLPGNSIAFSRSLALSSHQEDGGGWWSGDWLKLAGLYKLLPLWTRSLHLYIFQQDPRNPIFCLFLPFLLSQASKTKGLSEYEQIFKINRNWGAVSITSWTLLHSQFKLSMFHSYSRKTKIHEDRGQVTFTHSWDGAVPVCAVGRLTRCRSVRG